MTFSEPWPWRRNNSTTQTTKTNKTKYFWQSLRSTIRTLSQAKSKIWAQKITENHRPLPLQDLQICQYYALNPKSRQIHCQNPLIRLLIHSPPLCHFIPGVTNYVNGLNCTKSNAMFCYKCGKEFVGNELYCHQSGTWNRPEKKNMLHSLSDERSATEYYLERGFHYDTTVQVLAKHHSTAAHKCHTTKYFSQLQKFSGFKKDSWIVKYFQFSWKLFLDLWIKPGFEIVFSIWQPFQKQFVSRIVILNIFLDL